MKQQNVMSSYSVYNKELEDERAMLLVEINQSVKSFKLWYDHHFIKIVYFKTYSIHQKNKIKFTLFQWSFIIINIQIE